MTPEEFITNLEGRLSEMTVHRARCDRCISTASTLEIYVYFTNGEIADTINVSVSRLMLDHEPDAIVDAAAQHLLARWYESRARFYLGDNWQEHMDNLLRRVRGWGSNKSDE